MRTRGIWWTFFYGTLCNTGIFRTRGIFRTHPNIYYEELYSEPCVTQIYLKPRHFQNPRHIRNTVKHPSWNILFKTLCNPEKFKTLEYSEYWYILKSKHIQSPVEYLKWSILLKTLRNYSKTFTYSEPDCVSYFFMYQLFFRTTNLLVLLYSLFSIKSITYSLAIDFFKQFLVYELQSS